MEQTHMGPAGRLATRRQVLLQGMRDGIPIGLGYLAVSFSLGITARNAGLTPAQGLLASLLNNASAGEYAGFTVIAADAAYLEMVLVILIANARYLLMSCALSQKIGPETKWYHRLVIGFDVTDELFGIAVSRPGWLEPCYYYGAMAVSIPLWALGTALGVAAGNLLPVKVVSALSVALYGMFLAVIIPPARRSWVVLGLVAVSFGLSFAAARLPGISTLSDGTRTVLLTLLICTAAALLFPVREEDEHAA